jgi:hypothetical protein
MKARESRPKAASKLKKVANFVISFAAVVVPTVGEYSLLESFVFICRSEAVDLNRAVACFASVFEFKIIKDV